MSIASSIGANFSFMCSDFYCWAIDLAGSNLSWSFRHCAGIRRARTSREEPALRVPSVGSALASPVLSLSSGCVRVSRPSSTHKYPHSHVFVSVQSRAHGSPSTCSSLDGTQYHGRANFSFPRMASAFTVWVELCPREG